MVHKENNVFIALLIGPPTEDGIRNTKNEAKNN